MVGAEKLPKLALLSLLAPAPPSVWKNEPRGLTAFLAGKLEGKTNCPRGPHKVKGKVAEACGPWG